MLSRSRSYDASNASSSPARSGHDRLGRMGRGSDSSVDEDELADTVRKLRFAVTRTPTRKVSILESANPSPRVSMFEGPNISMLETPLEKKEGDFLELRKEATARLIGSILLVITIVQLVIIIYLLTKDSTAQYCSSTSTDYLIPRDYNNPGVFDDLTPDELSSVNRFLLEDNTLQLSKWDSATVNSSYIYMIELFLPNKTDVLQFIDRGHTRPPREAKVVVFRGNLRPPRVEEYIVSPLPSPTSHRQYRNPSFREDMIPFNSRPTDRIETMAVEQLLDPITKELHPLLMESFGLSYHNCTRGVNCMKVFDTGPHGQANGDRKSWVRFFPDIEGYYSQALGIEMLVNKRPVDPTTWSIDLLVYNGQAFPDAESLMEAYWLGRLQKITHRHASEDKASKKESTKGSRQSGPRYYEPSVKRFIISGQLIKYNNWQFNFNMHPSTGLRIFNVLFAGSRIAYEISLQEVLVSYRGYGAVQGNIYESPNMIGASSMELVKGVDCPGDAAFVDSYYWVNSGNAKRTRNNICVFERNSELPSHRHYTDDYDNGWEYYSGTPNYQLVVRTIATIWNCDYIIDYLFYNNGAIETRISLTGYVQSTFMRPDVEENGNVINDRAVATLNRRLFNFKVDVDIAGDLNRYTIENIDTETVAHPWFSNQTQLQMKIKTNLIQTESKNNTSDFKSHQYHLFHNKNAKNGYGSERSFRIINKAPLTDSLVEEVMSSTSWSKYPISVTRRKDSEPEASSIYVQNDPSEPLLEFDDFIDDESLLDEDIVAWVTLGMNHIPGTEDTPMTSSVWNQYSFFLAPHNYFWRSPDDEQGDTVKLRPRESGSNKKGTALVSGNNNNPDSKCVPVPIDYSDYDGRRN